jgi:catechol 2,3-dioxygenase-like lactoylglutathione lyase family enzyme
MITLKALHHVRFAVPDLEGARRFTEDFGLHVAATEPDKIFMKGTGGDAYSFVAERGAATRLIGLAFAVERAADLEVAVREHNASPVRALDGPGGGTAATLIDPDGNHIDLVHGIADTTPIALRADIRYNTGLVKSRLGARQYMPDQGPPQVIRMGHAGIYVSDFARSKRWYERHFGLLLSDCVYAGTRDNPIVGFFRLDRGEEWVDHHTLALFASPSGGGVQHISFEVQDVEAQLLAHEYLTKRGWKALWGVGRHELGSHIFDIWWDPNDIRFETFSDTDLCRSDKPAEYFPAADTLTRWGPGMPKEYVFPRGTPGKFGE